MSILFIKFFLMPIFQYSLNKNLCYKEKELLEESYSATLYSCECHIKNLYQYIQIGDENGFRIISLPTVSMILPNSALFW